MDGTITTIDKFRKMIRSLLVYFLICLVFVYAYHHDTKALNKDLQECREYYNNLADRFVNLATNETYVEYEVYDINQSVFEFYK